MKFKQKISDFVFACHLALLARKVSRNTKYMVAVHEAGHTFFMMKNGMVNKRTYIEYNGGWALGTFPALRDRDYCLHWNIIKGTLAGIAAEQLMTGQFDYACSASDRQMAFKYLKQHSKFYAYWIPLAYRNNTKIGPAWDTFPDGNEIEKLLLQTALDEALVELSQNKTKLSAIAEELVRKTFLNEKDLLKISQQYN